jgi:hypothetical protein
MKITLLNGAGTIDSNSLAFDRNTYEFFSDGRNVTDLISRADKLALVSDFDVERENERITQRKRGGGPLETSTTKILIGQLASDPLAAPIEALNNTANKFFALPGIQKLLIVGVAGALLYIAVKKA